MVTMLENKAVEVVEDSELGPEVVAELVSLQEELSSRPTKVIELPIESLLDLLAEPCIDLVPIVTAITTLFFLRSPDVYEPCRSLSRSQFRKRSVY